MDTSYVAGLLDSPSRMGEAEKIDCGGFQAYAAVLLGGNSAEPRALSRLDPLSHSQGDIRVNP
jgi:hypothetical protein